MQEAVEAYVARAFREGTTRASLCFNANGALQIDISCINLNFGAFWGGEWQSEWSVDTQTQELSGVVRVNNHYFEQGNIQFNLHKVFPSTPLTSSDGAGICAMIN